MKHLFPILLLFLLLLAACGEDRSHEYEELTAHNTWLLAQMHDQYLWGDQLAEPTYKNYFQTSTKFFSTLCSSVGQNDSWSYCLVDSTQSDPHERGAFNHLDCYGLDYVILTDPTKATSRQLACITYVAPDSPASECGLERGMFVSMADSTRLTSSNAAQYLKSGTAHLLTAHHTDTLRIDSLDITAYVWADTLQLSMPASRQVVEAAFPVRSFVSYGGAWIGYLLCTRLVDRPDELPSTTDPIYRDQLDAHMQYFIQAQPTELVLDLRYCNYGTLDMACRLASYIVPANRRQGLFAQTLRNQRHTDRNTAYTFDQSLPSLELSRIYVITGNYTQGAAEWLIRGLRSALGDDNVMLVGSATKGQNVLTEHIGSAYGHQFFPAVAYVADASGNYATGPLPATYSLSETTTSLLPYMKELGNPTEALFLASILAMFDEEE